MSEPKIFGSHQGNTLEQLNDIASRADHAAIMADGHLGYIMPVGGVAAYLGKVSVSGVGYDIACGNAAIRTDLREDSFERVELEVIADEIASELSFGVGRKNTSSDPPVDHDLFEDPAWSAVPKRHREPLRDKARVQLGTIGSGNHYVDVFSDESDRIWVGVHFGSRGFGHTVASNFLALSQGEDWGTRVKEAEALLDVSQPLGEEYLALEMLFPRQATLLKVATLNEDLFTDYDREVIEEWSQGFEFDPDEGRYVGREGIVPDVWCNRTIW